MNTNQLEWFCLAYETRSFAKAAENAFVSRQALGKALRSLEGELGAQLFERSETGVVPTAAAEAAYPIASRMVSDEHALHRACNEAIRSRRPAVRVAIANGVLRSLAPGTLPRLEESCPDIDFFIEKHYYLECFERLEHGEVNFALCPAPPEGPYRRWLVAEEEVFVAAAPELVDFAPLCLQPGRPRVPRIFPTRRQGPERPGARPRYGAAGTRAPDQHSVYRLRSHNRESHRRAGCRPCATQRCRAL